MADHFGMGRGATTQLPRPELEWPSPACCKSYIWKRKGQTSQVKWSKKTYDFCQRIIYVAVLISSCFFFFNVQYIYVHFKECLDIIDWFLQIIESGLRLAPFFVLIFSARPFQRQVTCYQLMFFFQLCACWIWNAWWKELGLWKCLCRLNLGTHGTHGFFLPATCKKTAAVKKLWMFTTNCKPEKWLWGDSKCSHLVILGCSFGNPILALWRYPTPPKFPHFLGGAVQREKSAMRRLSAHVSAKLVKVPRSFDGYAGGSWCLWWTSDLCHTWVFALWNDRKGPLALSDPKTDAELPRDFCDNNLSSLCLSNLKLPDNRASCRGSCDQPKPNLRKAKVTRRNHWDPSRVWVSLRTKDSLWCPKYIQ